MNLSGHSRRSHSVSGHSRSQSTVQGYLSSISSVSSSSLSSTGLYYAGEKAVPWQTSNSDLYSGSNTTCSSLRTSPGHVGTHHKVHRTMLDVQSSTFVNGHVRREQLPILAPVHIYNSPENATVQFISEGLDIVNMAVSP